MHNKIKENIEHPEQLEKLYRDDKKAFKSAFNEIFSEISTYSISDFWNIRLNYDETKSKSSQPFKNILFLLLSCMVACFSIKIPAIFGFENETSFYAKNASLIVFFGISLFLFLTKDKFNFKHILISLGVFVASAVYINFISYDSSSHSLNLVYIHLPLLLWCLYGLIFIDFDLKDYQKRIDFIKYNGDLVIWCALILLAGCLLTGLTLGLFYAIDIQIQDMYLEYIVMWGLVSTPIVATFIIKKQTALMNKIAPILAKIFSPLVLITLTIYLISILFFGKDPYNDRDFLLIFNFMLLGVMVIIIYSITEIFDQKHQLFNKWTLLLLTFLSLIINIVALSAIIYRLSEFGFSPNKIAVFGSNLLIFVHLILILIQFIKVIFKHKNMNSIEKTIAFYLPVYAAWFVFMVFVLPFIFGWK